jgi:hypothetical protein
VLTATVINAIPLNNLLMRELQHEMLESLEKQKDFKSANDKVFNVKMEIIKEKYIFFRSNNFKLGAKGDLSYGNRQPFASNSSNNLNSGKRNLIAANKKLFVCPSAIGGVIILNANTMLTKFLKKEMTKAFNEL